MFYIVRSFGSKVDSVSFRQEDDAVMAWFILRQGCGGVALGAAARWRGAREADGEQRSEAGEADANNVE